MESLQQALSVLADPLIPAESSRARRRSSSQDGRRPGRAKGRGKGQKKRHVVEVEGQAVEGQAGPCLEVGRRPGVRGRGRGKNRRLVPKKKRADRRFRLHSAFLNSNGRARTVDHVLTAPGERPASVAGRGKWKMWTPFAILRAGFGAEASAHRDIANQIDGAGHQNSAMSRYVVSSCVIGRQAAGLQEVRQLATQRPLLFYIRNIMWDETTFDLRWEKGGPAVTHSILCSHAQVAYRVSEEVPHVPALHGPGIRDQHVMRSPQVLPRYNTETIWQALSRLDGGFQDIIRAKLSATLTSCDAHRANLKCLRKLHCRLPEGHLLLISICAQHRAANCVEALTKAVGNLTGVFCLSKVFNYRNVLAHLRTHVRKRLEQVADRVMERPVANVRDWQEAARCAQDLVRLCKACMEPQSPEQEKKHPLDQLVDFFQGPWTGRVGGSGRGWQETFPGRGRVLRSFSGLSFVGDLGCFCRSGLAQQVE